MGMTRSPHMKIFLSKLGPPEPQQGELWVWSIWGPCLGVTVRLGCLWAVPCSLRVGGPGCWALPGRGTEWLFGLGRVGLSAWSPCAWFWVQD